MTAVIYIYSQGFYAQIQRDSRKYGDSPLILHKSGLVSDFCCQAARTGVREGSPLRQAMTRCPQALTEAVSAPGRYRSWLDRMRAEAEKLSSHFEVMQPNELILSTSSASDLTAEYASLLSLPGHRRILILAPGRNLALALGLWRRQKPLGDRVEVLRAGPGQEQIDDALKLLPIKYLSPCSRMTEDLRRLGFDLAGQLASIPVRFMVDRFGDRGYRLSRLCRGMDEEGPRMDHPIITETEDLEDGTRNGEEVSVLLDRVAARLKSSLGERRCSYVSLMVSGEGWERTRELDGAGQVLSAKSLRVILDNLWEKARMAGVPGSVTQISASAGKIESSRQDQMSLWGGSGPRRDAWKRIKPLIDSPLPIWKGEKKQDRREQVLMHWDPLRFRG